MTEDKQKTLSIEEFYSIATDEQKKLLSDLYDLVQKEIELAKKINNIYKSIENGIYSTDEGITLCEDSDDANVISSGFKEELKDVRGNIGKLLNKAVKELSMGNVEMIQRQLVNYENSVK
jgi:hypothetical protein